MTEIHNVEEQQASATMTVPACNNNRTSRYLKHLQEKEQQCLPHESLLENVRLAAFCHLQKIAVKSNVSVLGSSHKFWYGCILNTCSSAHGEIYALAFHPLTKMQDKLSTKVRPVAFLPAESMSVCRQVRDSLA